jgi:DNA-binding winged helix-turn-helix (wHTH) protein/tetratricopeptide (TPR) repeat protein
MITMDDPKPPLRYVRFGIFDADLQTGELRRKGIKIKLQEQPFQILRMLLDREGEVIARNDIQQRLWPTDTFVDFDRGLNRAVNKLREALGDSADSPRFIETLPRRGYRFIAPVVRAEAYPDVVAGEPEPAVRDRATSSAPKFFVTAATVPSIGTAENRLEPEVPLIGREHERLQLTGLVNEAMAGRGSVAILWGESGVGKTHLVRAMIAEATQRGCFTLAGHCYETQGAPPYIPFVEMLEYCMRALPWEGFRNALGDSAPEVAKLMPELRRMYPDIPPPYVLPPEQQRRFLFNAYREFVERMARAAPLLVVFEDLHWADESSLQLLQHLANTIATTPVLLIGTYCETELDTARPFAAALESLVRRNRATRIHLHRLPQASVEAMLCALGQPAPPPSLTKVIFDQTEGNPFFVEEIYRHLAEEGKLFDQNGTWRQKWCVDELHVPESIRLVIGRRLERLGKDTRSVLATAAVIGRGFDLRLLEHLEDTRPGVTLEALEAAEQAHHISAELSGKETHYRFVHELIRQTLVQSLSLPRRQRMHARIAGAMERVFGDNFNCQAPARAYHLLQAGAAADPGKTLHYLTIAASLASTGAAHEEALAYLDHAVSLLEGRSDGPAAELHARRAVALRSLSRLPESVESYERAIGMFLDTRDLRAASEASFQLAALHGWNADIVRALRVGERALQLLGDQFPHLRFRLLLHKALCLSFDDIEAAFATLAEAKSLESAIPEGIADGYAIWDEARLYWNAAQLDAANECAREAIARFRAAGDLWGEAEVWEPIPVALYMGRPVGMEQLIRDAIQRAERVGHQSALWLFKNVTAEMYVVQGDLPRADSAALESLRLGESLAIGWLFLDTIVLGYVAHYLGRLAESERWFRHGLEIEPPSHWSGVLAGGLFWTLAAKEDPCAKEALAKAYPYLPQPGRRFRLGACGCLVFVIEGLAWMGRDDEAAALQASAEHVVENGPWCVYGLYLVRTSAGIAAACAADWARAEEHHRAALGQADTAPYRVAQPIARYWYARMLLARRAEGDEIHAHALLHEALARFDSLGMPGYSRRTSDWLAKGASSTQLS